MNEISFTTTSFEFDAIQKVVDRAIGLGLNRHDKRDRLSFHMDMAACNANGCPMDFERMLAADDFNFTHDYCGIVGHLDRKTGKLNGMFLPRFAAKQHGRAA